MSYPALFRAEPDASYQTIKSTHQNIDLTFDAPAPDSLKSQNSENELIKIWYEPNFAPTAAETPMPSPVKQKRLSKQQEKARQQVEHHLAKVDTPKDCPRCTNKKAGTICDVGIKALYRSITKVCKEEVDTILTRNPSVEAA